MSYAVINNTGVLTFIRDQQFFFVAKTSIKSISLIRDEIIKLETDLCIGSIYIRHKDVTDPITFMPIQLMSYLRYWVVDLQPPGPNQ
jgi:hypothetical protein